MSSPVGLVGGPTSGTPVDHVVDGVYPSAESALEAGCEWIWFLDAAAQARPDALEHLLTVVQLEPERRKVLVAAGMIVDQAGRPSTPHLARGAERATERVLALAPRGLIPIRSAPFVHTLVAREAFERHGLPIADTFGPYAPVVWTARVLAEGVGYMVPASVATLSAGAGEKQTIRDLGAAWHTARTGTWTRGETVRAFLALRPGAEVR